MYLKVSFYFQKINTFMVWESSSVAEHLPSTHKPQSPANLRLMTFSCMILEEPTWQLDMAGLYSHSSP